MPTAPKDLTAALWHIARNTTIVVLENGSKSCEAWFAKHWSKIVVE